MPWTRLDDGFHTNPKVIGLSDAGFRLFVTALNWSVANLTDGKITQAAVALCLPTKSARFRAGIAAELVANSLWFQSENGWIIHDFSDYQESKQQVQERRGKWADQKRNQRSSKGNGGVSAVDSPMDTWPDSTQESWPESANPPHAGARVPPHPIREPLPTVEVSAVFDEAKSDLETGLEVWVDPTTGKQHHRVDGLWDAACAIWGIPETDPEKDRRNREIKQLRKARVRPDQLQPLVEKAVVRWRGEARPGLAGIIRNLGDLRGGFDIDKRSVDEFQENARRDARAQLAADMTAQKGLPA